VSPNISPSHRYFCAVIRDKPVILVDCPYQMSLTCSLTVSNGCPPPIRLPYLRTPHNSDGEAFKEVGHPTGGFVIGGTNSSPDSSGFSASGVTRRPQAACLDDARIGPHALSCCERLTMLDRRGDLGDSLRRIAQIARPCRSSRTTTNCQGTISRRLNWQCGFSAETTWPHRIEVLVVSRNGLCFLE